MKVTSVSKVAQVSLAGLSLSVSSSVTAPALSDEPHLPPTGLDTTPAQGGEERELLFEDLNGLRELARETAIATKEVRDGLDRLDGRLPALEKGVASQVADLQDAKIEYSLLRVQALCTEIEEIAARELLSRIEEDCVNGKPSLASGNMLRRQYLCSVILAAGARCGLSPTMARARALDLAASLGKDIQTEAGQALSSISRQGSSYLVSQTEDVGLFDLIVTGHFYNYMPKQFSSADALEKADRQAMAGLIRFSYFDSGMADTERRMILSSIQETPGIGTCEAPEKGSKTWEEIKDRAIRWGVGKAAKEGVKKVAPGATPFVGVVLKTLWPERLDAPTLDDNSLYDRVEKAMKEAQREYCERYNHMDLSNPRWDHGGGDPLERNGGIRGYDKNDHGDPDNPGGIDNVG